MVDQLGNTPGQRLVFQPVSHRPAECTYQQAFRLGFAESTGTQVKNGSFIQLTNRGAMTGFDFIRINFQLRLGINLCQG